MRSTITRVCRFEYSAGIEPLGAPRGHHPLSILSAWWDAKAPTAERRVVQLNLDAGGLRALRGLIDAALASES